MSGGPIAVTGAGGQVGSALVGLGQQQGSHVLGLTRKDLDVADPDRVEQVLARVAPAAVVNCAAFTDVDGAEDQPDRARAVNARGPGHLARVCAGLSIPLIHLSTDYVFDGALGRPYREDDPANPINTYGRTKLEGEEAVRAALDNHLIVRTSWVFAPGHRNFVTAIGRLAREREELRVVADQVGTPTPAGALAEVLLDLASRAAGGHPLPWGTYHLAGQPPASRHALAEAVVTAERRRGGSVTARAVIPVSSAEFPTRAPRPANTALDVSRARDVLGVREIQWGSWV